MKFLVWCKNHGFKIIVLVLLSLIISLLIQNISLNIKTFFYVKANAYMSQHLNNNINQNYQLGMNIYENTLNIEKQSKDKIKIQSIMLQQDSYNKYLDTNMIGYLKIYDDLNIFGKIIFKVFLLENGFEGNILHDFFKYGVTK